MVGDNNVCVYVYVLIFSYFTENLCNILSVFLGFVSLLICYF